MDQAIITQLIEKGLSTYKIAKELNCSQTNLRYWMKKYNLKSKIIPTKNREKKSSKEKYPQMIVSQRNKAIKRKLEFIAKLGGKCCICGYCKNWAALDFHHTEPSEKEIKLDLTSMGHFSQETLDKEIEKCQLLCANCHRETHNPDKTLNGGGGGS